MSVYGIISEFNPFHNGHKYIIDSAKMSEDDTVICVMSGNSVQRGELALLDKYYRAEMALECGADLVLELPYPYSSAGAEGFALAGVRVASAFADTLIFGSECGNTEMLEKAAEISRDEEFATEYRKRLVGNTGSAEVYFDLISEKTNMKYSSNDILGIEYIKAIRKEGIDMGVRTINRVGSGYNEQSIGEGSFQSATAIRCEISKGRRDSLGAYMPKEAFDILMRAADRGELCDMKRIERAIKLFFRMKEPEELLTIADVDLGLASRLCRIAKECGEGSMIEALRTKRYTDARLRRAVLFCLTGVRKEDIYEKPEYVNILGANKRGRELIAGVRGKSDFALLAKPSDIPNNVKAKRQARLAERLDGIFTMALERECSSDIMIKKSPVIFD